MKEAVLCLKSVLHPASLRYAQNIRPMVRFNEAESKIVLDDYSALSTLLLEELPAALKVSSGVNGVSKSGWRFAHEHVGLDTNEDDSIDYTRSRMRVTLTNGKHRIVIEETKPKLNKRCVPFFIQVHGPHAKDAFSELKNHFEYHAQSNLITAAKQIKNCLTNDNLRKIQISRSSKTQSTTFKRIPTGHDEKIGNDVSWVLTRDGWKENFETIAGTLPKRVHTFTKDGDEVELSFTPTRKGSIAQIRLKGVDAQKANERIAQHVFKLERLERNTPLIGDEED